MEDLYYKVISIKRNVSKTLTYKYPKKLEIGTLVLIPQFKGNSDKENIGIIVGSTSKTEGEKEEKSYKIKSILEIIDNIPPIKKEDISFIKKFAQYNCISISKAFKLFFPVIPKKKFNNIELGELKNTNIVLSEVQQNAAKKIKELIDKKEYFSALLYGLMGSGKTEVYLNCIHYFLEKFPDAQILILVPEILLIPEIKTKIQKKLYSEPLEWSSSKNKKIESFYKIANGLTNIIIGTRSALLLPYKNLRLIIIDEEQDSSYKQETPPVYNARDMAVYRAQKNNIGVILCSATPSIETYTNAINKKYHLISLSERHGSDLPEIKIINMNDSINKKNILAQETKNSIKTTVQNGKQVLILYNKKGFHTIMQCKVCDYVFMCDNCDIQMTVYQNNENNNEIKLLCHKCKAKKRAEIQNTKCPSCQVIGKMKTYGPRIECLEEEIKGFLQKESLNNIKITTVTSDDTSTTHERESVIKSIHNNKVNIILGTQIIAKGHNFRNVHLTVIVEGDVKSYCADYKANEKTYQLLHQMSGRAGRYEERGITIIQTYSPNSDFIKILQSLNYEKFYEYETQYRKEYGLPPFKKQIRLVISSIVNNKQNIALKGSWEIFHSLEKKYKYCIDIEEPQEAPTYKLEGKIRYQIFISYFKSRENKEAIIKLKEDLEKFKETIKNLKIDVDPYNFD